MDFWKRLFSSGKPSPSESGPTFSRSSAMPSPAESGRERQHYLQLIAQIMDHPPDELELDASLADRYGCDELDVSECVQCAEEAWGVQLMPNPMTTEDYAYMLRRFDTLQQIINEAERRAAIER